MVQSEQGVGGASCEKTSHYFLFSITKTEISRFQVFPATHAYLQGRKSVTTGSLSFTQCICPSDDYEKSTPLFSLCELSRELCSIYP